MFTPIFVIGEDSYIVTESNFLFNNEEKALNKGLTSQVELGMLRFSGSLAVVDKKLTAIPVDLPFLDIYCKIAIIDGPSFEFLRKGKAPEGFIIVPNKLSSDNIYTTKRIEMENKILTIAIGIESDTYEPYVLIGDGEDTQMVEPNTARAIANDLQFAAKAAEVDSFFYKSLGYVFKEIPDNKKELFMQAYREFREEYMERLENEQEETNTQEIVEGENKEKPTTGREAEEDGNSEGEEMGELVGDEKEEELEKAISEAYNKEAYSKE
jgi:hypothetical protein